MRLLTSDENGELRLTGDLPDNIPPYAILSHTWSKNIDEEVSFEDINKNAWKGKPASCKIEFCAEQARRDGLQYFWVDTCCINKSTIEEVQASINSMFQWYSDAARCYVYLSDVSRTPVLQQSSSRTDGNQVELSWKEAFRRSKWLTRGWTLQELLAPASVQLFSREGLHLGDKGSLEQEIHGVTKIPISALRKSTSFDQFGVDERLMWAEMRQTTREEDWAYCLLGIFGIFMPLNYGEGRDNAIRRLKKEIENTPKRQEWLRKLYTCPYRDRKDRNPPQVEGTCAWFTNHSLFQRWHQSSTAHLLWVSADPGCGKSVLAKYLVDKVLPITIMRTTCYFFFKEDFEDQRSSIIALRSILHQILHHHPTTFSTQVLDQFEDKGVTLLTSFSDLWDILILATSGHKRKFVCILDALDECEALERNQLIDAIIKFSSSTNTGASTLKFLLTSRPYLDINRRFRHLEIDVPKIHLEGENEEETAKISCEIDLVIKSRVADMSRTLELDKEQQAVLVEELTRIPSRTYLWIYLVLDEVEKSIILTPRNIRSVVRNIPHTVSEAYHKILSKTRDIKLARRLLHIVVAAARPLTLREMILASAIQPEHRSISGLDLLVSEKQFHDDIRQLCGLFLIVVDFKVYLLHQTAREFLVPPLAGFSPLPSSTMALQWEFSFHPKESHRILADICIQRLSLTDFSLSDFRASADQDQYLATRTFLQYAAQYWADHFREVNWNGEDLALEKAISYCYPGLPTSAWYGIYQKTATRPMPGTFTPLLVASYFGLSSVVERLPKKTLNEVDVKDSRYGRSPISWAAGEGHEAVVRQLLRGGTIRRLLGTGTHVDTEDNRGWTPLCWASEKGYNIIVQQLLKGGARVDAKENYGETPLYRASKNGHNIIVPQLLNSGSYVNTEHCFSRWAPLHLASARGHDAIVRQLLRSGADVNTKHNLGGWTPLHLASAKGHDTIVQQLLKSGADVNTKQNLGGWAPLHLASAKGHDTIVQQLLKNSADVNTKYNLGGWTPLHLASTSGHNMVVQQLLKGGADVHAKDRSGQTPLHRASQCGHHMVVQQLLEGGANVDVKDKHGHTPYYRASTNGCSVVMYQLLAAGAALEGHGANQLLRASGNNSTRLRNSQRLEFM